MLQHTTESHKPEKDRLFEQSKENKLIKKIIENERNGENKKSFQEIVDEVFDKDLGKCFEKILRIIGCSDERVIALLAKNKSEGDDTEDEEVGKLGMAGQGILLFKLLKPEEREKFWEEFIKEYGGQIEEIQSHDGCGAAGMIWDWLHDKEEVWDEFKKENDVPEWVQGADDLGKWWSQKLAKMINAKRGEGEKKVSHRHITKEEMISEIHDARAIYLDGTGRFNPRAIKEMPVGYVCSGPGFGFNVDLIKEEVRALAGIAFKKDEDGGHGFGERLEGTEDAKFYVIVCGKDSEQLQKLMKTAQEAVGEFGNKVEVKGFIHKVDESKE